MTLLEVIAASTATAARALKRMEYGSLKVGSLGDATILSVREGRFDFVDVVGDRRILSDGVVPRGCWWHPREGAMFALATGEAAA